MEAHLCVSPGKLVDSKLSPKSVLFCIRSLNDSHTSTSRLSWIPHLPISRHCRGIVPPVVTTVPTRYVVFRARDVRARDVRARDILTLSSTYSEDSLVSPTQHPYPSSIPLTRNNINRAFSLFLGYAIDRHDLFLFTYSEDSLVSLTQPITLSLHCIPHSQ